MAMGARPRVPKTGLGWDFPRLGWGQDLLGRGWVSLAASLPALPTQVLMRIPGGQEAGPSLIRSHLGHPGHPETQVGMTGTG